MIFKKKPPEQPKKEENFTEWEKDFGFLNLLLSRKKGITKEYLISIYSSQKDTKDLLTDEEIEPVIESIVSDVLTQISGKYRTFLVEKYFGTDENLVKFVAEDVYVDITTDAINKNVAKIKRSIQADAIKRISTSAKPAQQDKQSTKK